MLCVGCAGLTNSLMALLNWIGMIFGAALIGVLAWYLLFRPLGFLTSFLSKRRISREKWFLSVDETMRDFVDVHEEVKRRLRRNADVLETLQAQMAALNETMKVLDAYKEGKKNLEVKEVAERIARSS